MGLNNHGWGLREMIIYMCILILILLFVAFSIHALYAKIEKDSREHPQHINTDPVEPSTQEPVIEVPPRSVNYAYYQDLETKLYNATHRFLQERPHDLNGGIMKVDAQSLIDLGYLETMYNDNHSDRCVGYSNVYVEQGKTTYTVRSYIRCDNYSSTGY